MTDVLIAMHAENRRLDLEAAELKTIQEDLEQKHQEYQQRYAKYRYVRSRTERNP
jgi:hypothetical protein